MKEGGELPSQSPKHPAGRPLRPGHRLIHPVTVCLLSWSLGSRPAAGQEQTVRRNKAFLLFPRPPHTSGTFYSHPVFLRLWRSLSGSPFVSISGSLSLSLSGPLSSLHCAVLLPSHLRCSPSPLPLHTHPPHFSLCLSPHSSCAHSGSGSGSEDTSLSPRHPHAPRPPLRPSPAPPQVHGPQVWGGLVAGRTACCLTLL